MNQERNTLPEEINWFHPNDTAFFVVHPGKSIKNIPEKFEGFKIIYLGFEEDIEKATGKKQGLFLLANRKKTLVNYVFLSSKNKAVFEDNVIKKGENIIIPTSMPNKTVLFRRAPQDYEKRNTFNP